MTSFRWRSLVQPRIWSLRQSRQILVSCGLGPQRADAVLLIATTMEPAKRLGSEAEGKAWLDSAAQVYAQRVGISLSSGGSGSSAGGSSRHEQREVPQVPGRAA